MTDIEILERANDYVGIHYVNGVEDAYISPCLLKAIKNGIAALREQEEREKPLTLDELLEMNREPVWIILFDTDEEFWVLRNEWVDIRNPEPLILFHMSWYSHADYGKTWLAYRSKPKEE